MSEPMTSHADHFSTHLRLVICIAAKVAALHILAGRFNQQLSMQDVDVEDVSASAAPDGSQDVPPPTSAQRRELDKQEAQTRALRQSTVGNATRWLEILCRHLDVDMANLPSDPSMDTDLSSGLHGEEEEQGTPADQVAHEVASELVLVSVVMVCSEQDEEREKKQAKKTTRNGPNGSQADNQDGDDDDDSMPPLDYTALSRSLVMRTCNVLGVKESYVEEAEKAIAQFLFFEMESKQQGKNKDKGASESKEYKQPEKNKMMRWAGAGAGFVIGGLAIGLTGGLAAPALAPLLAGTFGIAAFSGASGAVLIGTLLGLGGGGLASYRTHRRMQGLESVSFEPIVDPDLPKIPSLTATIVASGFLLDDADSIEPWKATFGHSKSDTFAIKADPKSFLDAGLALQSYLKNKVISMGGTEVVKRTALASIYAGVALPLTIYNTSTMLLDSDFTRCRDKSKAAGGVLAEILEKQVQGKRPAILIGYGPGATIIFHCLLALHARGLSSLVYSATLISLPDSPSPARWAAARSVVAHELVSCFSRNDWVLAINARLYTVNNRVGGLQTVNVDGVRDVDCSDLVGGHLELRSKIPAILTRVKEDRKQRHDTDPMEKVAPGAGVEDEQTIGQVQEDLHGLKIVQ